MFDQREEMLAREKARAEKAPPVFSINKSTPDANRRHFSLASYIDTRKDIDYGGINFKSLLCDTVTGIFRMNPTSVPIHECLVYDVSHDGEAFRASLYLPILEKSLGGASF